MALNVILRNEAKIHAALPQANVELVVMSLERRDGQIVEISLQTTYYQQELTSSFDIRRLNFKDIKNIVKSMSSTWRLAVMELLQMVSVLCLD